MTTLLDQTSVLKWRASASSAWLSYRMSDALQLSRAPEIDGNRYEHHHERPDAGTDLDGVEEQPLHCFVDDPDTSQQQQAGFDESGKVFDLAVTELVVGIGGKIGDANRKET